MTCSECQLGNISNQGSWILNSFGTTDTFSVITWHVVGEHVSQYASSKQWKTWGTRPWSQDAAHPRLCQRIVCHTFAWHWVHLIEHACCRHMEAFCHALQLDESYFDHQGDAASPQIPGTPVSSSSRIRKVSALSDFAPVNLKVKRYVYSRASLSYRTFMPLFVSVYRRKKRSREDKRSDYLFLLLRWPLLVCLFLLTTVTSYWLQLNQVFYFFVHCGRIWVLCRYQTNGEYKRMDISLYVTWPLPITYCHLYTCSKLRAGPKRPTKKENEEL